MAVVLILGTLTSCAKQPKVSDASNYLLIQKELIKIATYGESLKSNKDGFISVTSAYNPNMAKPESNVELLTSFLNDNDCLKKTGQVKDLCYRKTRIMLINANKALDEANANAYYLNRSVGILRGNIGSIIDQFPEVKY